jgi:hypothetical protein
MTSKSGWHFMIFRVACLTVPGFFDGTNEIMKEILGRGLGSQAVRRHRRDARRTQPSHDRRTDSSLCDPHFSNRAFRMMPWRHGHNPLIRLEQMNLTGNETSLMIE